MTLDRNYSPPPDLRIVSTDSLVPHEEHDSQRAEPLITRLQQETVVINPPIVTPLDRERYMILDGANRYYAFSHLNYPHILVQVADYDSGYVELETWRHIICQWDASVFVHRLDQLEGVKLYDGEDDEAIAHILFRDGQVTALQSSVQGIHERNAALRRVVAVYQRNAILHRTALTDEDDIWRLHPDGIAIVRFPHYQPADILAAAREQAHVPPGISRHIIHGRALRVNYSLDMLRDPHISLEEKNAFLQKWLQDKLARRQVRYYAEATYQFDE